MQKFVTFYLGFYQVELLPSSKSTRPKVGDTGFPVLVRAARNRKTQSASFLLNQLNQRNTAQLFCPETQQTNTQSQETAVSMDGHMSEFRSHGWWIYNEYANVKGVNLNYTFHRSPCKNFWQLKTKWRNPFNKLLLPVDSANPISFTEERSLGSAALPASSVIQMLFKNRGNIWRTLLATASNPHLKQPSESMWQEEFKYPRWEKAETQFRHQKSYGIRRIGWLALRWARVLVWAQTEEEMDWGVPGMLCLLDISELSGPVESLFPLEYGPSSVG